MEKRQNVSNLSNKEDGHGASEYPTPYALYRKLRQAVDNTSHGYINSRQVMNIGPVSFDVKDMLILGAITGTDCLLTGKTGSGKTKLANLVMKGLFAEEYTNKTITPAMQPDDFLDIDFGVMKQGGLLRDAIKPLSILTKPGVILNEANRAPGVIQNYLIPFLDKEIDIQGKDFFAGVELGLGERYQFRIITINEGEQYAVEAMDRAIRDRTVIEIPLDMFYQTYEDCLNMLMAQTGRSASYIKSGSQGSSELVYKTFSAVSQVHVADEVIIFLTYLSGMSLCSRIKSPVKIKENALFSLEYCSTVMDDEFIEAKAACHFSKADFPTNMHNLCGNVRVPSQRGLLNLIKVARGAAFVRSAKTDGMAAETTIDDVMSVAPFVLHDKIEMNEIWIKRHYQGNKMLAVSHVMSQAKQRFEILLHKLSMRALRSPDAIRKFSKKYHDIWALRFAEHDLREKLYRLMMDRFKKAGGAIIESDTKPAQYRDTKSITSVSYSVLNTGELFMDMGDTVIDNKTGLMWTKDASISKQVTFNGAFEFVSELNKRRYAGYNDWRLPSIEELYTLIDYKNCNPALPKNHPFINNSIECWSSSTAAQNPNRAWCVKMNDGWIYDCPKTPETFKKGVWPVRSGQSDI